MKLLVKLAKERYKQSGLYSFRCYVDHVIWRLQLITTVIHLCIGQQPKEKTESQLPKTRLTRRSLTHRRISRQFSKTLRSTNLQSGSHEHDDDETCTKEPPDMKITRSTSHPHMGSLPLVHISHHVGHDTKPQLESIVDVNEVNTPKNLVEFVIPDIKLT